MTLSLDTAYRSFGGEVEASSTPTICRLPDSRRHQLSAIAPHPKLQAVRRLAQTLARYGDARRGPPISVVPRGERYEHLQPQSDYDRGTVLVPRHAPSPRSGGRGLAPQGTAEAAAGAEP